jgi:hypothetical protein
VEHAGQGFTHATPGTVVEEDDIIIVRPQGAVERFSELTMPPPLSRCAVRYAVSNA